MKFPAAFSIAACVMLRMAHLAIFFGSTAEPAPAVIASVALTKTSMLFSAVSAKLIDAARSLSFFPSV